MAPSILLDIIRCPMGNCIRVCLTRLVVKSFITMRTYLRQHLRKKLGRGRNVSRETFWLLGEKARYAALLAAKAPTIVRPAKVLAWLQRAFRPIARQIRGPSLRLRLRGKLRRAAPLLIEGSHIAPDLRVRWRSFPRRPRTLTAGYGKQGKGGNADVFSWEYKQTQKSRDFAFKE